MREEGAPAPHARPRLLSAYWNGAATHYRGLIRDLAGRGWQTTFYEPDAFERQQHRDIDPPDWAEVVAYPAAEAAAWSVIAEAARADVVVKASGVGVFDDLLLVELARTARPDAVRLFWDVDAPATLAEIGAAPDHPMRRVLPDLDLVPTYGGGPPVVAAYRGFGARDCVPLYNALDPRSHHPVPAEPRFSADLALLGNRLPDREARVEEFFLNPAASLAATGSRSWSATCPGTLPIATSRNPITATSYSAAISPGSPT